MILGSSYSFIYYTYVNFFFDLPSTIFYSLPLPRRSNDYV